MMHLLLAGCLGLAVVLLPGVAAGFEVHGTVVNGTTGQPAGSIKVKIVDPRHGMVTEDEIETDSKGSFVIEDLDEKISIYLLQVDYRGVTYTELLRPNDEEHRHMQINVYETTPDWDDVRVSIPHLMTRRSHDTLSVDRIFTVSNNTDPPRTIVGENVGFKIYLPEDRLRISSLFVTSLGIPITVDPKPTDTPGIYEIVYPFKPGQTRVGSSFDVAYANEEYAYKEPLQYDIEEVVILVEDPSMEVTSATLDLGEEKEVRGLKGYHIESLAKSTVIDLMFRGGEAQPAPSSSPSHQIVTLDDPVRNASIIIIVGFTLLLVLLMVFGARSPSRGAAAEVLASRKDALLNQIARLDDLFETGTVSAQLHRLKRSELVNSLSRIIYEIEKTRSEKSKTAKKQKGAAHAR
ncbi:MAG: hypothetical protein JSW58_17065 [Candidatus Latescibacterota bacterium]|nr:MAG: hypothetical protein JSW58_17065 [Candidatus Latescibacterota bacterium]